MSLQLYLLCCLVSVNQWCRDVGQYSACWLQLDVLKIELTNRKNGKKMLNHVSADNNLCLFKDTFQFLNVHLYLKGIFHCFPGLRGTIDGKNIQIDISYWSNYHFQHRHRLNMIYAMMCMVQIKEVAGNIPQRCLFKLA